MGTKAYKAIVNPGADVEPRRATAHVKKILLGTAFFIYHSAGIVLFYNGTVRLTNRMWQVQTVAFRSVGYESVICPAAGLGPRPRRLAARAEIRGFR